MKAFDKPQAAFRSWVVVEVFRGHASQKGGCRGEHESWVWKKQQRGCASGPLRYRESEYAASTWRSCQESGGPRGGLRREVKVGEFAEVAEAIDGGSCFP